MSEEERLLLVMRAASAPARDGAFVVAVLERAEVRRFRTQRLRALLRGAGGAAAAAGFASLILAAAPAQAAAEGVAAALALGLFTIIVRRAAARA